MIEHRHWRTGQLPALVFAATSILVLTQFLFAAAASAQESNEPTSVYGGVQQILTALNGHRVAAGLSPLVADPLLNQAAQAHADDILHNYNYSHRGSDGSLARQRVARTGYSDSPWVSENWVSSTSAEGAMTWWLNDYVHRVNILTPRWTEVGVGVSVRESGEMIFVTVFSAGRDASATVAVASSGAGTVAPPVAVPAGGIEYVIQPGDTLLDVAYRYELDWTEIARANAITDDRLLQIGQVLRIPDGDGNYTVGASSLGGTGGPGGYPGLPYEIQPYETLVSIAAKHGTTWEELARINGLGEFSILQIGQTIQVPVPLSKEDPIGLDQEESAAQNIEAGQEAPVVQEEEPAEDLPVLHLVQTGDTVFGIALAYSLDWQELLAINSLSEASLLQPGQPIRLR